jgi:hypothetical protein
MEYIKKEELIEDEIYKSKNNGGSIFKCLDKYSSNNPHCKNHGFGKKGATIGDGLNNIIDATLEEKHWLTSCITADKFIEYNEAMKTFIPEYIECTNPQSWKTTIKENNANLIFKNDFKSTCHTQIKDLNLLTTSQFKPSTKEAYDAQFVTKKPEFVLPEKWCIKNTDKVIGDWFNQMTNSVNNNLYNQDCHINQYLNSHNYSGDKITEYKNGGVLKNFSFNIKDPERVKITFEQFKQHVLKENIIKEITEPLSQFKIIEKIETITKVENNEGNQFFIGDIVKSPSDQKGKIISFKYSANKSNIIAITTFQINNGISINKLEHYIEPKVEIKELY